MQKFLVLALCVATATASAVPSVFLSKRGIQGIVDPVERCGGTGTPVQLRVEGCTGRCSLKPNVAYVIEGDFIPSAASNSLSFKLDAIVGGTTFPVIDTEIPGSVVQPGNQYTISYSLTPSDTFSGRAITLQLKIYDTASKHEEICVSAEVDIE